MFYYRKNKRSSFRNLNVKTKKEAFKVLKALGKDYLEYEIISELDYNNRNKKSSESNKIWKSLSNRSKKICQELLSNKTNKCYSTSITSEVVKQFDLDNKSNKSYYAIVWDLKKYFGLFCDINDLNDLYYKQINNYINGYVDDDIFMNVYNSTTLKLQKCDFSFSLMINYLENDDDEE